jgi:hypothetical protein
MAPDEYTVTPVAYKVKKRFHERTSATTITAVKFNRFAQMNANNHDSLCVLE